MLIKILANTFTEDTFNMLAVSSDPDILCFSHVKSLKDLEKTAKFIRCESAHAIEKYSKF